MSRAIFSAAFVGCLVCATGCPSTDNPGVDVGTFRVSVVLSNQFGGAVDCANIELVTTSSPPESNVFRDPGNCSDLTWTTGDLPLDSFAAQVLIFNANGTLAAESPVIDTSLDIDGEVVDLEFTILEDAGNFSLGWSLVGKDTGDLLTCAEAGGVDVVLETTLVVDSSVYDGTFGCDAFEGIGPYSPLGDFVIGAALFDGSSNFLGESAVQNLTIEHGGQIKDLGAVVINVEGM